VTDRLARIEAGQLCPRSSSARYSGELAQSAPD